MHLGGRPPGTQNLEISGIFLFKHSETLAIDSTHGYSTLVKFQDHPITLSTSNIAKMMKNEDFGLFRALEPFSDLLPGYQLILKNDRSRSSDGVGGTSAAYVD